MNHPAETCDTDRAPERVNFVPGILLGADDFATEQNYHREAARSHHRLHGWGTVCGLAVEATQPPSSAVVVSPGLAVDPTGREIVLSRPATVDLSAWTDGTDGPATVFVTIEYAEQESAPVAVTTPDGPHTVPSRIHEVPKVGARDEPPATDCPHTTGRPNGAGPCRDCSTLLLAGIDVRPPEPVTSDRIDHRRRVEHPGAPAHPRPVKGLRSSSLVDQASMIASLQRRVSVLTGAVTVLAGGMVVSLMRPPRR